MSRRDMQRWARRQMEPAEPLPGWALAALALGLLTLAAKVCGWI